MVDVTTSVGFPIAATDRLAEIAWSGVTHVEVQQELFFTQQGLAVKDKGQEMVHERRPGLPIVLKDDLTKAPGDELRIRMRRQLTNSPRGGNTTTYGSNSMIGSEEAMVFTDCIVYLGLLKNAVGFDSPDWLFHRTSIDMEGEAQDALREWLVENHEEAILDCGYEKHPYFVQQTDADATAVAHPRLYYADGKTTAAGMDASNILKSSELMRMRSYARHKKLNPIRIEGKKSWVLLADNFVCNDLRSDARFREAQAVNVSGASNPLISGAIGSYLDIYVHEYERMRRTTSGANAGSIGRCLLLGADAIAVAYGSEPRLVPRVETNYGDRWGLAIRQVFGAVRCDFRQQTSGSTTVLVQQSSAEWDVWEERDEFAS